MLCSNEEAALKLFSRKSDQGGKIILTASQFAQYQYVALMKSLLPRILKLKFSQKVSSEPNLAG